MDHVRPEEFKQKQASFWTGFMGTYSDTVIGDRMSGAVYDAMASLLVARVGPDAPARVLDIASASGEPSLTIARALPRSQVVSTDLVKDTGGAARAASAGASNITFQQADAEDLSQYGDASFDAVVCSFGLMFLPNVPKALAEAARVLKPGGLYLASVWGPMPQVAMFSLDHAVYKDLHPEAEDRAHMACRLGGPALEGVLQAARDAGLAGVSASELDFDIMFATWAKLEDVIVANPGAVRQLLLSREEQGNPIPLERVQQALHRHAPAPKPDGAVLLEHNLAVLISGTKPAQ